MNHTEVIFNLRKPRARDAQARNSNQEKRRQNLKKKRELAISFLCAKHCFAQTYKNGQTLDVRSVRCAMQQTGSTPIYGAKRYLATYVATTLVVKRDVSSCTLIMDSHSHICGRPEYGFANGCHKMWLPKKRNNGYIVQKTNQNILISFEIRTKHEAYHPCLPSVCRSSSLS